MHWKKQGLMTWKQPGLTTNRLGFIQARINEKGTQLGMSEV
jgi:hypothetical protein